MIRKRIARLLSAIADRIEPRERMSGFEAEKYLADLVSGQITRGVGRSFSDHHRY